MKAPNTTAGGFDRWSRTYDRSVLQALFFDRVHDALLDMLRRLIRPTASPRIIDAGCGTGRLLIRLGAEFPSAVLLGVDPSEGMIDVARAKPELAAARLEVAAAGQIPFDDASCDVAVSTMSFHHWADQAGGLRDVARVLRTGRPFLLVDVFATGPAGPVVRLFGSRHGVGMRTRARTDALLAGAGMEPLALRRIGPALSPLGTLVARRR